MARPVIVVSTGRSGSTLVSRMVREHPRLLSLSEFFILIGEDAFPDGDVGGQAFWEILSRPHPRLAMLQRSGMTFAELLYRPGPDARFTAETGIPPVLLVALPHLTAEPEALFDELAAWVPALEPRPIADQYRTLFDWLCRRMDRSVWVERSGASLSLAGRLARTFPEAGIVHLYRDGRDCAISMSRHDGFKMMAFRARPDLAPPDMQAGGLLDTAAIARARVPPEVTGRIWSEMITAGAAELAALPPDRVMRMCYEQLVADPRAELRRLAAFIGVEADPGWLGAAAALVRPSSPRWTELAEPERSRLVEACAPGMRLLYGTADPAPVG